MHGKAPTRRQKLILEDSGLDPKNFVVLKNLSAAIIVRHRGTGEILVVRK